MPEVVDCGRFLLIFTFQLFVRKHAATVEPEVLKSIPVLHRLSMMTSFRKTKIRALAGASPAVARE